VVPGYAVLYLTQGEGEPRWSGCLNLRQVHGVIMAVLVGKSSKIRTA
jgi:hypothetical protein